MDGGIGKNWTLLQYDLKPTYFHYDIHKYSMTALTKLVNNAPQLDLNMYIIKYSTILEVLFKKGKISTVQRICKLISGLPEALRTKTVKFCFKKGWKLLEDDDDDGDDDLTKIPEYKDIKEFLLSESQCQKTLETISELNDSVKQTSKEPSPATPKLPLATPKLLLPATPPASSSPATASLKPSDPDPVAELTKQFSQLALQLQASFTQMQQQLSQSVGTSASLAPKKMPDRQFRCIWCDSLEHRKFNCTELLELLRLGKVRANEAGYIVNPSTGQEYVPRPGRGGMKTQFQEQPAVVTNAITLDPIAEIGTENSVFLVTVNPDGSESYQIIDVDVEEKRKLDDQLSRRVQPRPQVVVPRNNQRNDSDGSQPVAPAPASMPLPAPVPTPMPAPASVLTPIPVPEPRDKP